jgi:ABC-type branched-subunit amino acid transport system ATPase component
LDENELLNQRLEATEGLGDTRGSQVRGDAPPSPVHALNEWATVMDIKQWAVYPNGCYRAIGPARPEIPTGIYKIQTDDKGVFFQQMQMVTDDLIVLPDTANDRVLTCMRTFWKMEKRYKDHGLLYKRGILLWGPPGSGKTATLQLLTRELVSQDGLVIISDNPALTAVGLAVLRRIEPDRRLIVMLEDVDETINRYSEHELLGLLDGEQQVDNVVMIATTNYPERLGARIVNRPSRFDERILVDMPSAQARRVYLQKVAHTLGAEMLEQWVEDTDKLSVAHLRELTAAVLCLDQPYEDVLERLRSMRIRPREMDGFNNGRDSGFAQNMNPLADAGRRKAKASWN